MQKITNLRDLFKVHTEINLVSFREFIWDGDIYMLGEFTEIH